MRLGTRGSALALQQAHMVRRLIEERGGPSPEIVIIKTSGDEGPPDTPVPQGAAGLPAVARPSDPERAEVGAAGAPLTNLKRMFVKEIEEALLEGRIDLAVHSSKDLPAVLPDGLMIGAALEREDPRDALLLPEGSAARELAAAKVALGNHPRIGTSSVRRTAELRAVFPSATFIPVRGNVDTRLRKLDAGVCDALVLAAAGVKRLGLETRISACLPLDLCVPAPGQGIVAIEIAEKSSREIRQSVAALDDADAIAALVAERAVVQALGGGCQMPLGVLAVLDGQQVRIHGLVASLDGRTIIRANATGSRGNPRAAGEKLARLLLDKGAGEILR